MDTLNPRWLSIELESIDADIKNWSEGLWASYVAAIQTLTDGANAATSLPKTSEITESAVRRSAELASKGQP